MKPPIFVCDESDVLVFLSVKTAESFLEGPDVEDLKAYDAEGRLLVISAVGYQVKVTEADDAPLCEENLKTAIRNFLSNLHKPILVPESTDLASLVVLMERYAIKEPSGIGCFPKTKQFFRLIVQWVFRRK